MAVGDRENLDARETQSCEALYEAGYHALTRPGRPKNRGDPSHPGTASFGQLRW